MLIKPLIPVNYARVGVPQSFRIIGPTRENKGDLRNLKKILFKVKGLEVIILVHETNLRKTK